MTSTSTYSWLVFKYFVYNRRCVTSEMATDLLNAIYLRDLWFSKTYDVGVSKRLRCIFLLSAIGYDKTITRRNYTIWIINLVFVKVSKKKIDFWQDIFNKKYVSFISDKISIPRHIWIITRKKTRHRRQEAGNEDKKKKMNVYNIIYKHREKWKCAIPL